MEINIQNLEKLLIKNWSSVISPREIKYFLETKTKTKILNFGISRFEWLNNYFIIWIEYHTIESKEDKICELRIYSNGNIEILHNC